MNKYQRLISTPPDTIIEEIKKAGSILATMRAFGFLRGDDRARLFLLDFVKQYSLEIHCKKYLLRRHQYTKDIVQAAVSESFSMRSTLKKLGLTDHGGNRNTVRKLLVEYKIDTSHFSLVESNKIKSSQYTSNEIFCEQSEYARSSLAGAVRRYKVLDYKCVKCNNIGEWFSHKLNLTVDHINGNHKDNRIENLRYLCPNCHSLTDTFAGKNKFRSVGEPD